MYVYFDEYGTLKEIISDKKFRVGDSKRDKIYVYWAGEHTAYSGWVKYRKPNGKDTVEECFFQLGDSLVAKQLPTKPLRNLKYFSYDHTYEDETGVHTGYLFYELTVPDEILNSYSGEDEIPNENNMIVARIRFVLDEGAESNYDIDDFDTIATMGALVFSVEENIGILTDSSIDQTQYNYLVKLISTKVGYGVRSEKVNDLPSSGEAGIIYYVKNANSSLIYDVYFWNGDNFIYIGNTSYGLYTEEQGEDFEIAIQTLWNTEMQDFEALINSNFSELSDEVQNQLASLSSLIQSAASGSPKGTYATVSALTTANPNHNYVYIVLADGKWYYWNTSSSVWTAGGTYLSTGNAVPDTRTIAGIDLVDDITKDELNVALGASFYSGKSRNLFIEPKFIAHTNIDFNSGIWSYISNGNPNTVANKEFIEIEGGETYVFSSYPNTDRSFYFLWYDENKAFISYAGDVQRCGTAPATAKYVRIKISLIGGTETLAESTKIQLEKGKMSTQYVPPFNTKNSYVTFDNIKLLLKQTNFYKKTKNLFDYDSFELGYLIGYTSNSAGVVLSGSNLNAATLNPIEVDETKSYTITTSLTTDDDWYAHIYEYAADGTYLGRASVMKNGTTTISSFFTGTKYIKLNVNISSVGSPLPIDTFKCQIEEGSVATDYVEPFIIESKYLPESSGGGGDTPSEEDTQLEIIKARLDAIRPKVVERNSSKNYLNFAFCTDTHLENDDGNQSGYLDIRTINELGKENWIDFVAHGGDIFNSYASGASGNGITLNTALQRIDNAMRGFDDVKQPLLVARGNHDVNRKYNPTYPDGNVDTTQILTKSEFALMCQAKWAQKEDGRNGCSFYRDFDEKKVRVIVLDVYDTDMQLSKLHYDTLNWLANTALMLGNKSDYSVLIICHNLDGTNETIITPLITAFKAGTAYNNTDLNVSADYTSQGEGTFVACVCGHTHVEGESATNGYWVITSKTSYLNTSIFANIFTLDSDNHILYKQKIGTSGHSYAFDYVNLTYTDLDSVSQ